MFVQMQVVRPPRDVHTDAPRQFHMTAEEADNAAEQEDERAEEIIADRTPVEVPAGPSEDDGVIVLQENQCPWCGFSDHKRKSKTKCPQHPQYVGDKYTRGAKVVAAWVPGSRSDHKKRARERLTTQRSSNTVFSKGYTIR